MADRTIEVTDRADSAPGAFRLVDERGATPIHRVGSESVVGIAAGDLADDVERVSDCTPSVVVGLPHGGKRGIIVGTYGACERLDRVVAERVPDHGLEDHPERYAIATVESPAALDLERALLIIGSDPRGTAYGVYELSERIGVSPWYWWADVPPDRQDDLFVSPGVDIEGPPSVRYRGIFLNDEDFGLRPWATETHEPESPDGIGPKTYERVFELLLRLKGNTIWPAMHGGGNAFYEVEGNREAADRYGILVGTSHCEPMHRNNVEEWDSDERGEWNYETNADAVRAYWRERLEAVAETENIFTLGMRGIHDSGMPGGETLDERVALLQSVLDDQREMLAEIVDPAVEEIPQIFCPYKEVLELYHNGLSVPEDVTVVWPNDSFGYMRRLPTGGERTRSGGHGVYYHLSYWGRPHDHQWLCSTPPALIREELHRAYAHGARELWIANVGDLKPAEKETEYFFDLAWDADSLAEKSVGEWLERWASREFGPKYADEISSIMAEYYRLGIARKPEHMGWNTVYPNTAQGEPGFSAIAEGDEARRRLKAYAAIDRRAERIAGELSAEDRTAFFHLVGYPVRGAHLLNRMILDAMRSRLYAGQGRASAGEYADRALAAHDGIRTATERYNESSEGKWRRMMSAHPRDLPVFDPPAVARLEEGERPALGVAVEGDPTVAGTANGVAADQEGFELPELVAGVDHSRFVDIFNRGGGRLEWTATAREDWLVVSEHASGSEWASDRAGVLESTDGGRERRLWIRADWDAAPDEPSVGELRIEGAGTEVRIDVSIRPRPNGVRTPNESAAADDTRTPTFHAVEGRVVMEAEHPTRIRDGETELVWERVEGLGRTTDAAMALRSPGGPRLRREGDPDLEELADRAPRLEYDFDWPHEGVATLEAQLRPTHAPDDGPLRYAVGIDGGDREVVAFGDVGDEHDPEWQRNVLRGTAISQTCLDLEPGRHSLAVYGLDPSVVLDRLVVRTGVDRRSYLGPRETREGALRAESESRT